VSYASFCGLVALVTGLFLATSLPAQGGGTRIGPLPLLVNESVQQEIKLTADQKARVAALHKEYMEAVTGLRADVIAGRDFSALSDGEQAKWEFSFQRINADFEPKNKEFLNPNQLERVREITYQVQGPSVFSNPDVTRALTLIPEQLELMSIVNQDYNKKMQALNGDSGSRSAAVAKLRHEQIAELTRILTKEQTEKWIVLRGKPFDISTIRNQRFYRYPWFSERP
jgi:hypothetical protein